MSQPQESISKGLPASLTAEVMAFVAFIFIVVFVLLFIFYLKAKLYIGSDPATTRNRNRHLIFVPDDGSVNRRGLDPTVIGALPVTVFRSADFKDELECAVCLSELLDGDDARILPDCKHGFHLECIDMWFQSNSTCPLCRTAVGSEPLKAEARPMVPPDFRANVILDCASSSSSSSSEGYILGKGEETVVIEIPSADLGSPESTVISNDGETRSPTMERLRSLKTLVRLESRAVEMHDLERGGGRAEGAAQIVGGERE